MGQHSSGSQLSRVQIGWKALEKLINETRDRINANMPVEGSGTRIEDVAGGKMISYSPGSTTSSDIQQPTTTPQDPHLLATGIIWYGVKWQSVTVVDPSTCAQSTLSVLVSTGNDNDSITIEPVKYPFWVQPV